MKLFVPIALAATVALGAATVDAPAEPTRARADCERTTTGLVPLTDMGRRRYRGQRGGLYPFGRNRPSPAYQRMGLAGCPTRAAGGRKDRRALDRHVEHDAGVLRLQVPGRSRSAEERVRRARRRRRAGLGCAEDQVGRFSVLAARRRIGSASPTRIRIRFRWCGSSRRSRATPERSRKTRGLCTQTSRRSCASSERAS